MPSIEVASYIASLPHAARCILDPTRHYWSIENSLHWTLDVALAEDLNCARTDHAPQNLATLRHFALNLLKQEHSLNVSVKAKRLRAAWDDAYLLTVLAF